MAKNKPQIIVRLVAANDNQSSRDPRNPIDPRLVSLAQILARQVVLAQFNPANDHAPPATQEEKP